MQTEDGRPEPMAFCYGHMNAPQGALTVSLRHFRLAHKTSVIQSEAQRSRKACVFFICMEARNSCERQASVCPAAGGNSTSSKGQIHENVPGK